MQVTNMNVKKWVRLAHISISMEVIYFILLKEKVLEFLQEREC